MKNWDDYIDENGLVVQKKSLGGDGGDSLNRTAAYVLLTLWKRHSMFELINVQAANAMIYRHLEIAPGQYIRSPHPNKWYNTYDRTSRDQLTPLVILLGIASRTKLKAVLKDHLKRLLLFTTNTRRNHVYSTLENHLKFSTPDVPWNYSWKLPDLTGPEFWGLYIRGFNSTLLRPLLWLSDFQTLIGSICIRFSKQDDVINHALILEYGRRRMNTILMKLANKITPSALLQERLDSFFGVEIEPPINNLYRSLFNSNSVN